jgi:quercetin dioxygenase-like cupin family protein
VRVQLVLDGVLVLTIDSIEHRLTPGHGCQIPDDVAHAARAEDGRCRVPDVFHPVCADYRHRVAQA